MRWLRGLQRVRTSTWILLAIFLVTLAAYLVVRPESGTSDSTAQVHSTTSPTPSPAASRPTPSPTSSPKATHASPTPGLGSTPHTSVSPSPSPSPLGSPSPSASDPTPSAQAS